MVVLAIVAVACFVAGVWGVTKWLPPLAEGSVESLVYFVVCGLAGAALVVFGVHIWDIVRELEQNNRFPESDDLVASELVEAIWQAGTLAALALIPYLLARKGERIGSPG